MRGKGFCAVAMSVMLAAALAGCSAGTSATTANSGSSSSSSSSSSSNSSSASSSTSTSQSTTQREFSIEGKWKNVGKDTFGQAQSGSIVTFDGTNCNFFSPQDTYAFYEDDGAYVLDCTSVLTSKNLTFDVEVIDEDNISISYGDTEVELKRVG